MPSSSPPPAPPAPRRRRSSVDGISDVTAEDSQGSSDHEGSIGSD
jgi:hypothetical protein